MLAHNLLTPAIAPSSLVPELGDGIDAVVLRCLHKNPELRYSNMAELADDLAAMLEEREPTALSRGSATDEDRYTPRSPFSQLVSKALHKRLGRASLASFDARKTDAG